jgi:micrococcal nuclease
MRKSICISGFFLQNYSCKFELYLRHSKVYSLAFFVVLISISSVLAEDITGKVVSVIDGNTIEVQQVDQTIYKVVLAGIDCPEIGQEFGDKAKKFLEKIILNKSVSVKLQGKDRWGNYLGVVLADDDDPRVKLLKEGLAWTAEKNPSEDLEPLRQWAEQKGKGLWKEENPTPPWTYRRQQSMMKPKSS